MVTHGRKEATKTKSCKLLFMCSNYLASGDEIDFETSSINNSKSNIGEPKSGWEDSRS
jgi:hypothetical protein